MKVIRNTNDALFWNGLEENTRTAVCSSICMEGLKKISNIQEGDSSLAPSEPKAKVLLLEPEFSIKKFGLYEISSRNLQQGT